MLTLTLLKLILEFTDHQNLNLNQDRNLNSNPNLNLNLILNLNINQILHRGILTYADSYFTHNLLLTLNLNFTVTLK